MYIKSPQLKPVNYNSTPNKKQRRKPSAPKIPKLKFIIGVLLLILGGFLFWKNKSEIVSPEEINLEKKSEPIEEQEKVVSYTIAEGDIPADVFAEYGKLNANDTLALLTASEEVYDFTKIKIGQKIDFIFNPNGYFNRIQYYPNTEKVIIAKYENDDFKVTKESIPYEIEETTLSVKIDEYLYKDALDAGLTEASVLELADIFSFDIDFTTEIRAGDELKVVYEKRTLEGESAPDGKILAAKFFNDGHDHFAYYFESEGEGSHYDSEGHELVRQFLRAPLSYRKITSGYTGARFHPITKTVTAHYQIDYAAPIGTPVVSTARGTVASASWENGWGNMVRIRHDNGYTTHYGHLSAYGTGIRSGVSVSQGQVIGYVGSTGWSTGPHLDYGMKLNGSPINPLSLKLPKGIPLSGPEMELFQQQKAFLDEKLK